ncbi:MULTISPECIES: hypothetical protein [Halorussus]|uniref:hypothetical protein n=1 Tax=Halorussus TaxID=1070314 RepID=UPI0020A0EA2E|nr:hypothetical protein [Halorussus vallis]USZ77584.1 hypothetical protein NGM07_09660 [Halorussus vallis]
MQKEEGARDDLPEEDVPRDRFETRLPARTAFGRWFFFEANRGVITAIVLLGVLVSFLGAGSTGLVTFRNEDSVVLLLSVLIGGNFTLITINQLVLSREFGKPHVLRERNEGIAEFRRDVQRLAGVRNNPIDPFEFVRTILAAIDERARVIESVGVEATDPRLREDAREYAEAVTEDVAMVDTVLAEEKFGTFRPLVTMLYYRTAWQLHGAKRIQYEHGGALPDRAAAAVDDLGDLLQTYNVAREYLQTVYLQDQLAKLSRFLLYVGVPTLLAIGLVMLVYTRGGGVTVPPDALPMVISVTATLAFAPLTIVLAYVIRVPTIVSRMPMLNPFITDG